MKPDHILDQNIWLDSYKEEYNGLTSQNTFDIISGEEYHKIHASMGKHMIPSMCILSTKKDANGHPSQAKS